MEGQKPSPKGKRVKKESEKTNLENTYFFLIIYMLYPIADRYRVEVFFQHVNLPFHAIESVRRGFLPKRKVFAIKWGIRIA